MRRARTSLTTRSMTAFRVSFRCVLRRTSFSAREDPDPRGMTVYGADRVMAGTVVEAWIDRSEVLLRYLEVELVQQLGGRRVLLPMNFLKLNRRTRRIAVGAILGSPVRRRAGPA